MKEEKMEGSSFKLDAVKKFPELLVNERVPQGESRKKRRKCHDSSIEDMKERPNIAVEEETEEMKRWRGLNQSEMDLCWKNLAERMEEEALDKFNVEESQKGAFKGRGNPLEWKRVRRSKKYRIRKW